jgi:hypothetical protein
MSGSATTCGIKCKKSAKRTLRRFLCPSTSSVTLRRTVPTFVGMQALNPGPNCRRNISIHGCSSPLFSILNTRNMTLERSVESYASSAGPSRPQRRARREHVKRMGMPKVFVFTSFARALHALRSGRSGATSRRRKHAPSRSASSHS